MKLFRINWKLTSAASSIADTMRRFYVALRMLSSARYRDDMINREKQKSIDRTFLYRQQAEVVDPIVSFCDTRSADQQRRLFGETSSLLIVPDFVWVVSAPFKQRFLTRAALFSIPPRPPASKVGQSDRASFLVPRFVIEFLLFFGYRTGWLSARSFNDDQVIDRNVCRITISKVHRFATVKAATEHRLCGRARLVVVAKSVSARMRRIVDISHAALIELFRLNVIRPSRRMSENVPARIASIVVALLRGSRCDQRGLTAAAFAQAVRWNPPSRRFETSHRLIVTRDRTPEPLIASFA